MLVLLLAAEGTQPSPHASSTIHQYLPNFYQITSFLAHTISPGLDCSKGKSLPNIQDSLKFDSNLILQKAHLKQY